MATRLPEGMVKRGRMYHADFYAGGKRIRRKLSKNLKTAKTLLTELQARAERSEFGLLDNNYPLATLKEEYLRHCRQSLKASSVDRYEDLLDLALPDMPVRVAQLTMNYIIAYRAAREAAGDSANYINAKVGVVSAMLTWGVETAKVIGSNPLKGLRKLRAEAQTEGRALSTDEVTALLDVAPARWRDVWYCYLTTGMRNQELATLMFSDIDWESREIVVRADNSKNHKPRRIPIDNELWNILTRLEAERPHRQPSPIKGELGQRYRRCFSRDHVFISRNSTAPMKAGGIWCALMRSLELAGIEPKVVRDDGVIDRVDVHSLRRTFATDLIVNGTDPKTVQELMGHATLEMTMKLYAKIHFGTKRQAIAKLSWGTGTSNPEHMVSFPAKDKRGHDMVTSSERQAVSG